MLTDLERLAVAGVGFVFLLLVIAMLVGLVVELTDLVERRKSNGRG